MDHFWIEINRVPPQGRQAIFLGDLIDRGPEQIKVVHIVRAMVDAGNALSVMGNHEFNAIGYATERRDAPGEFLRPHSAKNIDQHVEFLRQAGEGSALHREMVDWFKDAAPALDLGGIRVVHAWWHQAYVDLVAPRMQKGVPMDDDFLRASHVKGSPEWQAMEGLTKGLELRLPKGEFFVDHSGVERHDVRAKWWNDRAHSYRDVAILDEAPRRVIGACWGWLYLSFQRKLIRRRQQRACLLATLQRWANRCPIIQRLRFPLPLRQRKNRKPALLKTCLLSTLSKLRYAQ